MVLKCWRLTINITTIYKNTNSPRSNYVPGLQSLNLPKAPHFPVFSGFYFLDATGVTHLLSNPCRHPAS